MKKEKNPTWQVYFKPAGEHGWTGIRAIWPARARKGRDERNLLNLAWNGERFADGTEYRDFRTLPFHEQADIMAQIDEARAAGWFR